MKNLPKPTKLLDDAAEVQTPEDVNTAMAELAWMTAQQAAVDAEIAAEVAKAKKAAESRLKVGAMNFADRMKLLLTNVEQFARKAKAVLLEGVRKDGKTAKMTHGSITFKDQRERIEIEDSESFKRLTEGMEVTLSELLKRKAQHAVVGVVTDPETGEEVEEKVCVASLLNVKVSLDKAGALACWKNDLLTKEQFQALGLAWSKPDENVTVKIDTNAVVSASAEAA